ncbi:MAG: pyruvate, water dikinase regulatory protein [Peptoniphilaceae bacterium]|nr:kinase/pyrophosphorylase [Peptoniphilaceae bacterium]MDY3738826.1 pyruvate, water dikinase regulatory protein [Peptoniphilaceae bacterium]
MQLAINIISDTSGYATKQIVKQTLSQFDTKYQIKIYPNVRDIESLKSLLNYLLIYEDNQIIYHSLLDRNLNIYLNDFCNKNSIERVDVLSGSIDAVSKKLNKKPNLEVSSKFLYDSEYFRQFDAVEFAIKYDDGKDFKALKLCDIALIGLSRTTKTPLSIYLASKGYKVANIPLVLESAVPKELFEVDANKIFGLTLDKDHMVKIRRERLKLLNLPEDSQYSNPVRIDEEIAYAESIMEEIGCTKIDVTGRALEESADIILSQILKNERRKDD